MVESLTSAAPIWAKLGALTIFALLLLLVWSTPRERVFSGARDEAPWRDLRLWATLLILLQALLYLALG